MTGRYPDSFYRISLKAIIRNEKGEVLLVKENGDGWSFPGGGMSHGENVETSLARELYEEVLIDMPFTSCIIGTDVHYIPEYEAWLLWIIHELTFPNGYTYGKGVDADEVAFVDALDLKDSADIFERLVYKWSIKKSPH